MKRILKKKIRIFEKEVSVLLIALISVATLVSAALIPYLSNVIMGTATVASPTTLTLWNEGSTGTIDNQWEETVSGGEEMMFSKIIKNDLDTEVLFGVALVFKDTDGEGIQVTSAGPCGPVSSYDAKCMHLTNVDTPAPINNVCWCQNLISVDGYLHGQCSYETSLGAVYDDAVKVTVNNGTDDVDYYVVLFGATTDETGADANGVAQPDTTIKKLGWGTPTTCNTLTEEGTNLPADAYDTGTIRVDYAVNLLPQDYLSAIEVVQPGQTLKQIIDDLEARPQAEGGFA